MILIDFEVDEMELTDSLEGDITQDDYLCFLSTMFIMPVRFQIEDCKVYDFTNSSAPIISLASDGIIIIKDLKNSKREHYGIIEGPGDIEFTMVDDITVELEFLDSSSSIIKFVNYNELLQAFEKFAAKVRAFFWERAPQLNDHPVWGPWLRGERD